MDWKLAALLLALCFSIAAADRGFLLTCPRSLEMNSSNAIQLRLYEVGGACEVTVALRKSGNDSVVFAEERIRIEREDADAVNVDVKIFVPHLDNEYNAQIRVNGSCDGYEFFAEDECYLRNIVKRIIFIQTDKPFYKPRQTIKLRAMQLDRNLKPMKGDNDAEIWVEDPTGSRMAQWKPVPLNNIRQFEFDLSEEPVLGNWKICCRIEEQTECTYVDVKEYVLPKFEVTITPPSFVLADVENITVQICAKYTYGKGVPGTFKINTSLETYAWSPSKFPVVEFEGKLEDDGCTNYTINVSLVDTDSYYSYRRIQCVAVVAEDGTGISRNATKQIERTSSPLNIQFPQQRDFFKPGLPHNGKLSVTLPDGRAAAQEVIETCYTVTRERMLFEWHASRKVKVCRNFTTNARGHIDFTVPPQNIDAVSMYIEAQSTRYASPGPRGATKRPSLQQPQASASLRPYFSRSGSFVQLRAAASPAACGATRPVELLFTAGPAADDYRIYYEIVSKGAVIKSDSVDVHYSPEQDVSDNYEDPARLIDAVSQVLVPARAELIGSNSVETEDCPSAKEARYVPPIGSATINVEVTPEMSGSFYLLVFYVRGDREVVADSQKYTVEKCFKNKVGMEFGDQEKQPGTRTTLRLTASPHSLCGIKVIDKQVKLIDASDQLTPETVFQATDRFDSGYHYSRNHCNDKVHQPGLTLKSAATSYTIIPPRPWSSSNYEDSMTAFEVTGFIVMSDMVLFTRPCKGSGHNEPVVFAQEDGIRAGAIGGGYHRAPPPPRPTTPGAVALASVSSRRPAAQQNKLSAATKSAVEVRRLFPEDWLFTMVALDETGELTEKHTLPHTITEWVGSAICLSDEDGLGLSNTTSIRGFQAFFLDLALPYSVVRGETFPLKLSVFNYLEVALPISVSLEDIRGYELTNGSLDGDYCVPPGRKVDLRASVRPRVLGTLNFTLKARTAESPDVCAGQQVAKQLAADGLQKSVQVDAEGFPHEQVKSELLTPEDGEYENEILLEVPEDVVPDSARAYFVISGDPMGPALENMGRLVVMPSGCGEQNMAKFAPNIVALEYLKATRKLTDAVKNKAVGNLRAGYQRQMKYRHPDGSYSAFGASDRSGSSYLTGFAVESFARASRHVDIDPENLATSIQWLLDTQLPNGCFQERGNTIDHGLKGGLGNARNQTGGLTAYILKALLVAGMKNATVADAALRCIELDARQSALLSALYAYVYALASTQMEEDTAVYREGYRKHMTNLVATINSTGGVAYFQSPNASESIHVETAAYAVLAQLQFEEGVQEGDLLAIVRFLTRNRNAQGGFHSTQDTVLGIQAISEYAARLNSEPLQMKVTTAGSLTKVFELSEDNRQLVSRTKIAAVPSTLRVTAVGQGTGLFQTILRYNTASPPLKRSFSLTADFQCKDEDCSRGDVMLCARYLTENRKSSMSLLEVKMVSGMAADRESLDRLMESKDVKLKRYDIDNNVVALYFDEFSNESTCLSFTLLREMPIENCKAATVKVYDYYAKENSASTSYTNTACSGVTPAES